jgi:hypothetical protein
MNTWSGTAAGVTLGTDGTMTVFVRGSNSGESGVDWFFLPRVTIVYEGLVEVYFGGLQRALREAKRSVNEKRSRRNRDSTASTTSRKASRTSRSVVAMSPIVEKTAITKKRVPATTSS